MDRRPEAITLLNDGLREARLQAKQGHQIQFLILLGKVYADAQDQEKALEYLEAAGILAQKLKYYRVLAQMGRAIDVIRIV